jgi:serine/threonine protein kinase
LLGLSEDQVLFAKEPSIVSRNPRLVQLNTPWKPSIVVPSHSLRPLEEITKSPDFGVLDHFVRKRRRKIDQNDTILLHLQRDAFLSQIDKNVSPYYDPYEDRDFDRDECRPPKWKYDIYPVCNLLHELSLDRLPNQQEYSVDYVGYGLYREVFRFQRYDQQTQFVLKTLRNTENFRFDIVSTWYIRGEAMLLEKLSSSPRLADIYGFCSFTTLTQVGVGFGDVVVPRPNWKLRLQDERPPLPQTPDNQLLPHEKLKLALEMAEGLAELHGYHQGVICHDDVSMSQWLWNDKGEAFLNDVNTIRVLEWNDDQNDYCPYFTYVKVGEYRPIESFSPDRTSMESDDVWSFGNILFSIVTGVEPWIEKANTEESQKAVLRGEVPAIPPLMDRNFTPIEHRLMEIVALCHRPVPEDRASIFLVLEQLRDAWKEYEEAETTKSSGNG